MNNKENRLKTIYFDKPDYIPVGFHVSGACWYADDQDDLCELMDTHKILFPNFTPPPKNYKPEVGICGNINSPYTDDFGCVWETTMHGITGTVTRHPLSSWDSFKDYRAPNPMTHMGIGKVDWDEIFKNVAESKKLGLDIVGGGLTHNHTFLRLCDIRGYQNLLYDMVDEEPNLFKLIEMVEEFNLTIINQYIKAGCELIGYGEDLGMQVGPMLSPKFFKKYIKPSYTRLMKPAKDNDLIIHMHSDGDIRTLVDDMIDSGVQILNLQDNCNGIEWIKNKLKSKICIDLDIDRQFITVNGTPKEIDDYIRYMIQSLGSREGGLSLVYGLYPGIPIERTKALMDALEKYIFMYN